MPYAGELVIAPEVSPLVKGPAEACRGSNPQGFHGALCPLHLRQEARQEKYQCFRESAGPAALSLVSMTRSQSGETNIEMCWAVLPATRRALEQADGLLFEIQEACCQARGAFPLNSR